MISDTLKNILLTHLAINLMCTHNYKASYVQSIYGHVIDSLACSVTLIEGGTFDVDLCGPLYEVVPSEGQVGGGNGYFQNSSWMVI